MAEYIGKLRVPVRVRMPGMEPLKGFLSVGSQSAIYEGPETLFELLNAPLRVLPFILANDESVMLLTREHIDWVEAGKEVEPDLVSPRPYLVTREETVAVEWLDGSGQRGKLPIELPSDINRASDFMNSDDDFFPLATSAGNMLINKRRLRAMRIFSASPGPTATIIEFPTA